jgi:hypothetical protein
MQVGIPIIGKWPAGIGLNSRLVLAARGGIGILVYKQLGVERHTESLIIE